MERVPVEVAGPPPMGAAKGQKQQVRSGLQGSRCRLASETSEGQAVSTSQKEPYSLVGAQVGKQPCAMIRALLGRYHRIAPFSWGQEGRLSGGGVFHSAFPFCCCDCNSSPLFRWEVPPAASHCFPSSPPETTGEWLASQPRPRPEPHPEVPIPSVQVWPGIRQILLHRQGRESLEGLAHLLDSPL